MKKSLIAAFMVLFATQAQASVLELIESVKQNNLPEVLNLLEKGENVNATNAQGNTPLHYAVATDNAEIAKVLLEKGADINASNAMGWTPLKIAQEKQVPNVLPILQKAVQDNKVDEKVSSPTSATFTSAEKEQYIALIERAREGILYARKELDAARERHQELEAEIEKLKADNARLEKSAKAQSVEEPQTKTEDTTAKTQNTPIKTAKKQEIKSVPNKPKIRKTQIQAKPSIMNPQIFAGQEEVVYCLNYFGQGGDENMLKAAGYYASTVGINQVRYNRIADLSNAFFASADINALKKRSDECSKIITPTDAEKQNMIIRSLNYAIGH